MGEERRKEPRRRCIIGAQIRRDRDSLVLDCRIKDMSASGARVLLDQSFLLPKEFELLVPSEGKVLRATAVRHRPGEMAVKILEERRARPRGASADPKARILELEAENRLLRRQLEELRPKVEA